MKFYSISGRDIAQISCSEGNLCGSFLHFMTSDQNAITLSKIGGLEQRGTSLRGIIFTLQRTSIKNVKGGSSASNQTNSKSLDNTKEDERVED
ncbi:hypothetical protein P8452_37862 [Trifolium repens]|nr:hypothetical protein P8452_37862 [Trifolium repens]